MIDCHTHVVAPDQDAYPLNPRDLSGEWYREAPASAEDLARAMAACGVSHAVLVQGVGAYGFDNRYVADAARSAPDRFVSACALDMESESAAADLDYWVNERGVRGIRLFALSREGPSWLNDHRTFPVWDRARTLDVHVIITILPHQLHELEEALQRFPDMPVSLDHCGFALGEPATRERLFKLSKYANLNLKVSTHNLDEAIETSGSAQPIVSELVSEFGAPRLMWGSDFCQTHDRSYADLVAIAQEAFRGLSEDDRHACLSETARRLWPQLR